MEDCKRLAPDIILMDINMPGLNGIQATQQALAHSPQTGVIMLTMLEDDASVFAAMRAGARGYYPERRQPGRDAERDPLGG